MTGPAGGSGTNGKPEISEIEADLTRTREELADTVDELTARLDVTARTRDRVREARMQVGNHVPTLVAAAVSLGVVVTSALLFRRWRRR